MATTPCQAPHHVTHGQRGVVISVTTYHISSIMKILSGECQDLFKTVQHLARCLGRAQRHYRLVMGERWRGMAGRRCRGGGPTHEQTD